MANGNLKTQAEYYGDSEKYTGNGGTVTNKWVIEDWQGLINNSTGGTAKTYYEIVNDIDFNDAGDYKFGYNGYFHQGGVCDYEGNNHTIYNLILSNRNIALFNPNNPTSSTVSNLSFKNLIIMNDATSSLFNCILKNCHFGVYMFNAGSEQLFGGLKAVTRTDCTYNIKGVTKDGLCFKDSYIRCHINADIKTTGLAPIEQKARSAAFKNSYITGKILQTGSTFGTDNNSNYLIAGTIAFTNSYIAVDCSHENSNFIGYAALPSTVTSASTTFLDKDLIHDLKEETSIANFYYLTTEQCKDPNYLLSINFPVVPLEGE